jgi:hypothetical protein
VSYWSSSQTRLIGHTPPTRVETRSQRGKQTTKKRTRPTTATARYRYHYHCDASVPQCNLWIRCIIQRSHHNGLSFIRIDASSPDPSTRSAGGLAHRRWQQSTRKAATRCCSWDINCFKAYAGTYPSTTCCHPPTSYNDEPRQTDPMRSNLGLGRAVDKLHACSRLTSLPNSCTTLGSRPGALE